MSADKGAGNPFRPFADLATRADEVARRYRRIPAFRAHLRRIVATIDETRRTALLERYRDDLASFLPTSAFKYADLPHWLAHKLAMACDLGLDRAPPLAMLDIGMGGGHLCKVAQELGHRSIGTDLAMPFYDDLCDLFGVVRVIQPVRRCRPYPNLGERFDLVTIVWQTFDRIKGSPGEPRRYWLADRDWGFLLRDLAENHLKPGGRIYMALNRQKFADGEKLDQALLDWSLERGARVVPDRAIVDFEDVRPGRF